MKMPLAIFVVFTLLPMLAGGVHFLPVATGVTTAHQQAQNRVLPAVFTPLHERKIVNQPDVQQLSPRTYTDCAGIYWAQGLNAVYYPRYCYGHDEAGIDFISNAPGSGSNAIFDLVLPNSTPLVSQGQLYVTFWFGGIVYDPAAIDQQAFLEFQFYPVAPANTGNGSGAQDCSTKGESYAILNVGSVSNEWFACAFIFAFESLPNGTIEELAPFAGALDLSGSSDSVMVMNSGDLISLQFSGVAQSATQGWQISVQDYSSGEAGSVTLVSGSQVFSPYYDTASFSNHAQLLGGYWTPISFAYEIGHSILQYNPSTSSYVTDCSSYTFSDGGWGGYPGDGSCLSYWPGAWAQSGLPYLFLPVMGTQGNLGYPSQIAFTSSQGGAAELYNGYCPGPSFSTSTNCMYPFYVYSAEYHSFSMQTSIVPFDTYDYGNVAQFPTSRHQIVVNINGRTFTGYQWNASVNPAPWGTVSFAFPYSQLNYSILLSFGSLGYNVTVPGTGGSVELPVGSYTVNVSTPGCASYVTTVSVGVGSLSSLSPTMNCPPPKLRSFVANNLTTDLGLSSHAGFTVSLSSGVPPFNYSVYVDGAQVSHTTSDAMRFSSNVSSLSLQVGHHSYLVQVTDELGRSVSSSSAGIAVNPDPTLAIYSARNETDAGVALSVQAQVSLGTPPYSYRWYVNGVAVGSAASYAFSEGSTGSYSVEVSITDAAGFATNRTVSVIVNTDPSVTGYSVKPSASLFLYVDNVVQAGVSVSGGTTPYTYEWLLNGEPVTNTTTPYFTYRLNHTGSYTVQVRVIDEAGYSLVSSPAPVTFSYNYPVIAGLVLVPVALIALLILSRKRATAKPYPPPPPPPTM